MHGSPAEADPPARWVALITGLVAAIPVIVSTVRGLSEGWVPFGDRAVIAIRAFDVFTAHPPLLGQYSAWSTVLTRPIFSPGPLLYWLLAIPAHFLPPVSLAIWMGAVNVVAVMGIVVVAGRRGGAPLMFAVAVALDLMTRSLTSETYHDIWDPSSPLLLFTLLFFLAWSVACGEYRLLPIAALVFSFEVETHLAFLVPSLGLLVVALAGLAASRRFVPPGPWRRGRAGGAQRAGAATARPPIRRWAGAALIITAICWLPPVVNQIFRLPGNLFLIAEAVANRKGTIGLSAGWHTIERALGIVPWWLKSPVDNAQRLYEVVGTPGVVAEVSTVSVLAGLVIIAALARRRGRADVVSLAVIALVLSASLGLGTESTPTEGLLALTIGYTLWWAAPAGMFVWLALGWSVVQLSGLNLGAPARHRGAPIAGLLAVALVAAVVAQAQGPDVDHGDYRPFGLVVSRLAAALPHPGTVVVTTNSLTGGFDLQAEVVYALKRQGATVFAPGLSGNLGSSNVANRRHYDHVVSIGFDRAPAPGGRVIARVTVRPPAPVTGHYVVTLR